MMKVGIIGAGRIGKVHGESIMRYVKDATVKAIADPFMNAQTEAWAKGLGIAEVYTDYHKILEDKEIEAVLIRQGYLLRKAHRPRHRQDTRSQESAREREHQVSGRFQPPL